MAIPASLRRQILERAQNRCEYCGLSQEGQEATFHIDHIIPVAAGGKSTLENLALAIRQEETMRNRHPPPGHTG